MSPRPVTGPLREEPGFDGLVVSDAVEMRAVRARYGLTGAAVRGRGPRLPRRHIGRGRVHRPAHRHRAGGGARRALGGPAGRAAHRTS
ncbi:hypothetical protein ACIHCV_32600 [Streptomyces sp. NPDC051956]|uniref:hypothetical protein n=1 Tax=Streptomyces sp. NPDC051956 TaxID=3365677 RepID=UPI0037D92049